MSSHVEVLATVAASDPEREATVERLRGAVGRGLLDLDEFDRRAGLAYAAHTRSQLRALTRDLVAAPPAGAGEQVVARFGDIEVTRSWVRCPTGSFALQGSVWRCFDYWYVTRVTPGWAVALAVLGFFVVPFVSLLFLLIKEPRTTGVLQVAVWDGARQHVVDLPVGDPAQARTIECQVGRVRAMA